MTFSWLLVFFLIFVKPVSKVHYNFVILVYFCIFWLTSPLPKRRKNKLGQIVLNSISLLYFKAILFIKQYVQDFHVSQGLLKMLGISKKVDFKTWKVQIKMNK